MKTFDYEQVSAVLAPLKAKFDDCAHGEGNACEALDKQLECCATICYQVINSLRTWADGVFTGEVILDPQAEEKWRLELTQICSRATEIWQIGRKAEVPCWEIPGQNMLASALWEMRWLLDNWVSPKLAVAPMPRSKAKLSDEQKESIRQQLSSLPPLQGADKR
jgi:hypothetical protein